MGRFQRFSLDNSMVKKLYTRDDSDDENDDKKKGKKVSEYNEETNEFLIPRNDSTATDQSEMKGE